MDRFPSTEAIEGVHTFPGPFTIKLFGPHDQSFVDAIKATIAPVVSDESRYALLLKPSSKGTHCCVDVTLHAENAQEVQTLYAALHDVEGLKMLL